MPWQFLAAGLALASGIVVTSTDAPDLARVEVFSIASEPYSRMTVPVSIHRTGPYQFLIDTGAQATVVSRALADKLALNDRRPATLVGIASRRQIETAAIDGMELGRRNFNVATAPLVDGANIGGADGVLGLDALQGQRVLIDFKGKSVHVAPAKDLGGNRGYEIIVRAHRILGQLIITQARLDGVKTAVIIDTGAQGSTGNPALLDRLRRRSRDMGEATVTDINGISLTGPVRFANELVIDQVELHNLPILFAASPTFEALGLSSEPTLILGMEQLRLFNRVAIDFDTQRVLFDLPPGEEFTTGTLLRR
ncbi:MAG: aspartyl protease family protein [Croceibacterium sp.]